MKRLLTLTTMLSLAAVVGGPGVADAAGFVLIPVPAVQHPVAMPVPQGLVSSNTPTLSAAPASASASASGGDVMGYGDAIPLHLALGQILPPDFVPAYGPGIDPALPVSWTGGSPWLSVLNHALAPVHARASVSGFRVDILSTDPSRRALLPLSPRFQAAPRIAVAPQPAVAPMPSRPTVPDTASIPTVAGEDASISPAPRVRATRPAVAPQDETPTIRRVAAPQSSNPAGGGDGTYTAVTGDTLSDVLQRWAAANGWNVVDDSQMVYPIQAGASFSGSFESASRSLIESIQATPRPHATFYHGNNTVHVFVDQGVN